MKTPCDNCFKVLFSIIICLSAGFFGMLFTTQAIPVWYDSLNKPFFNPPSFVFAPVWTALYILMGISLFLVWKKGFDKKNVKEGMLLFGVQLALNALWSFSFFGLRSPVYGLVNIFVLLAFLVATIYKFYQIDKRAAYLLIPYILWVSFATVLNAAIFVLN